MKTGSDAACARQPDGKDVFSDSRLVRRIISSSSRRAPLIARRLLSQFSEPETILEASLVSQCRWVMALLMKRSNRLRSVGVMVVVSMICIQEEHKDGHHTRIVTYHPGSPERPVTPTKSGRLSFLRLGLETSCPSRTVGSAIPGSGRNSSRIARSFSWANQQFSNAVSRNNVRLSAEQRE